MARMKRKRRSLGGLGADQFAQDIGSTRWFRSGDTYVRTTFRGLTQNDGASEGYDSYSFRAEIFYVDEWDSPERIDAGAVPVERRYGWEPAAQRAAHSALSESVFEKRSIPREMTSLGSRHGEMSRLDRAPRWVKGLGPLLDQYKPSVDGLRGLGTDAGVSVGIAAVLAGAAYFFLGRHK
jgi:hypothetical protein